MHQSISAVRHHQDISASSKTTGHIPVGDLSHMHATARLLHLFNTDPQLAVPPEVEHTLIWTKVPIYHPKIVAESVKSRIDQDGLWGFTGNEGPPPSPANLVASIGALTEWGITLDRMVKSEPPTIEEAALVERAGSEVHRYVQTRWSESEWETAWFVNPPVRSHFCQEDIQ